MESAYLDWNILSQTKSPKNEVQLELRKKVNSIKNNFFIPYSPAHLEDLRKGYFKEGPDKTFTQKDLEYIDSTTNGNYIFYNSETGIIIKGVNSAIDSFESYKEPQTKVIDNLDLEKVFSENEMEDFMPLGKLLTDMFKAMPVPVNIDGKQNTKEFKDLQQMLPSLGSGGSMYDLMQDLAGFVDEINVNPEKYKNVRNGFRTSLDIPTNISNAKNSNEVDTILSKTKLTNSFDSLTQRGLQQNKKNTFYDEFILAYANLDMIGFHPEELNKKNTYKNFSNDAQHAFFATYCDCFVTSDATGYAKAKFLFEKYQLKTKALTLKEFLELSI